MTRSRKWKPGDVAMTIAHRPSATNRAALRSEVGDWVDTHGACWTDSQVLARPLVVLDPEDPEQMTALAAAWDDCGVAELGEHPMPLRAYRMQAALRSLVADPRPDEPTGLGAVVEDAEGRKFIRYRDDQQSQYHWTASDDGCGAKWSEIAAVRVLSEGWSE